MKNIKCRLIYCFILLSLGFVIYIFFQNIRTEENRDNKWYNYYHFIAHSGGGIDGRTYTNSLESWNRSYANGLRVFDADLNLTNDNMLVLRHEWSDNIEQSKDFPMIKSQLELDANGLHYKMDTVVPSYNEFMSSKIYRKYTPMDIAMICDFMKKHKDVYISIDAKTFDTIIMLKEYIEKENPSLFKRIIVNIYTYDEYYKMMEIYNWDNITIRQHFWCIKNWKELASFCKNHDINVVNVSVSLAEDEGIEILKKYNLKIYYSVVDHITNMNYLENNCYADGFVTNWLTEDDWYIE